MTNIEMNTKDTGHEIPVVADVGLLMSVGRTAESTL